MKFTYTNNYGGINIIIYFIFIYNFVGLIYELFYIINLVGIYIKLLK